MTEYSSATGLATSAEIYRGRDRRIRELKAAGRKVVGYICCYSPVEVMTALDLVPFRLMGNMEEPIVRADGFLPTSMCAFCRSCFDLGIQSRFDFIDGFVGSHACDAAERVAHIWRTYIKAPCTFFLDLPHTDSSAMVDFFKTQLIHYARALEDLAVTKATPAALKEAIVLHNRQRSLVRSLYRLRRSDPPLVSGSEVLQTLLALMCIPAQEGNQLLEQVIAEVQSRRDGPRKKPGRLMIWGSLIDNVCYTDLIESSGFNIVIEDTAVGARPFWHDIEITEDPFDGMALHYLREIKCPRTFSQNDVCFDYTRDLENRFGYLKEFAYHWSVNSAFLNVIRNCDIHGYEIPSVTDYLESLGLPVLVVEHDYSIAAMEGLRTRFQAFAERIGG